MAKNSENTAFPPTWKILMVDDHPVVRESLALRIAQEADMEVCAAVGTRAHALTAVQHHHPDLAVLDMNLPDGHGLDLIKDIHAYAPDVRMLVFSMHDERVYGERALRAGAQGYIMKSESPEEVIEGIRRILHGKLVVSDAMSQQLLARSTGRARSESSSPVQRLTDRELQVYRLIAEGRSTSEIAGHLCLSIKTVETHRAHIKEKLGLRSATELVVSASRWLAESPSN